MTNLSNYFLTSTTSGTTPIYKSEDYTMEQGETVYVGTQTGTWTITLPSLPTGSHECSVWDAGDNASNNKITIDGNGATITTLGDGEAELQAFINMNGGRMDFMWDGSTWIYSYVVQTIQPDNVITHTESICLSPRNGLSPPFSGTKATTGSVTLQGDVIYGDMETLNFPGAASYYKANGQILFPDNWQYATRIRARYVWCPSTTAAGNAAFSIRLSYHGDDGAFGGGHKAMAPVDASRLVNDEAHISDWSVWNTPGELTENRMIGVVIINAEGHTYAGTAQLIAIQFEYEWEETLAAATAIANTSSAVHRIIPGTTHTLEESDNGKELIFTNASPIAITIPDGLPIGFQCIGKRTTELGIPTFTPTTETINGVGTGVSPAGIWKGIHLTKFSDTEWFASY